MHKELQENKPFSTNVTIIQKIKLTHQFTTSPVHQFVLFLKIDLIWNDK